MIDCKTMINSIGLIIDIGGAVLLYFYGIHPVFQKDPDEMTLGDLTTPNPLSVRYKFWSKVGFICLIAGFVLQLSSNFIK